MAALSLDQAQAHLDGWLTADLAVATNQSYAMPGGRMLTRAHAAEIRTNIEFWDRQVRRLTGGGLRVRGVTPV